MVVGWFGSGVVGWADVDCTGLVGSGSVVMALAWFLYSLNNCRQSGASVTVIAEPLGTAILARPVLAFKKIQQILEV